MRNNEGGEFELVVGNRQLISAFFIVVLLFAVAFAMGYVVGQNSPRSAKLGTETAASSPAPAVPASPAAAPAPSPAPAQPAEIPQQQPAASAPPPETTAPPAPETASPPPENTAPNAAPANPAAAAPPAAAPPAAEAPPGSYWQVMAVNSADAEVVVRTLKEKGFPASMTPGPNNLMRVLVGPYTDTQTMGRAKTELEREGFHPIRH